MVMFTMVAMDDVKIIYAMGNHHHDDDGSYRRIKHRDKGNKRKNTLTARMRKIGNDHGVTETVRFSPVWRLSNW